MTADPNRLESLFAAALAKAAPEERAAYLDEACAGDPELRQRVEGLLRAYDDAGSFLEKPAEGQCLTGDLPAGQASDHDDPFSLAEGPGMRIGPYKLLEQIGEGGMGTVWVAEQTQPVRRKVALKLIKAGMDSKTVLARFEAERQALALMDHPNIAKIFDGGTTGAKDEGGRMKDEKASGSSFILPPSSFRSGRPFFVMEYVKGVPFTKFCDDARLSIAERLALFVPVCQAVQHAHQKGIIHRDLKPSNILVCLYDGRPVPKVIDFGLAKALHQPLTEHTLHTAHGVMMGTPLYVSPEQAELNNLDVDTRTDIYALGVILYELLTGTTPLEKQRFKEAAWHEMLRLIKEEEPPKPSARLSGSGSLPSVAAQRQLEPVKLTKLVRGELDWIVMKCLEKERARRYDTATGLARDLERYLADEAVEACPPSASYRLRKFVHRNQGRVIAAGMFAALLFLVVGLVLYGVWWASERRQEQALIVARNNEAFAATLNQIEAALKAGRLEEAGTLLGQAHKQTDEHTPADLRERHELLKRDERTIRELNEIFEERWMISRSDTRLDNTRAKRRYPPLFQSYGLAVGTEPAAATEAKIRQSLIAEALSSGMTEWFFVDPKFSGLLAVVDLLDPEPGRAALRKAIATNEEDRIRELGKTIDGSQLSPAYAIGLGTHPAIEEPMRILKAAWTAHPDSFPLALSISTHCYGSDDKGRIEAVGWSRIAVALRPNNPLAHYHHAIALSPFGDSSIADAADELRRTIRLAPRFARAHARLAFVLRFAEKTDKELQREALDAARAAIKLDNQSMLGHFVLYDHLLLDKKDFVEAAHEYRVLMKAREEVSDREGYAESGSQGFVAGYMSVRLPEHWKGLIDTGRPFEAYHLILNNKGLVYIQDIQFPSMPRRSVPSGYHVAVRAAALAGCGKGLDAPPLTDRPAIRKHAQEWLNASLDIWKKDAAALPAFGVSTVGLMASPSGHGPLLLAIPALSPGSPHTDAYSDKSRKVVHDEMNHWLGDPDLAGIRDDQWLDKLPGDEREQWRKLWADVHSLRDRTAPAKAAPPPVGK